MLHLVRLFLHAGRTLSGNIEIQFLRDCPLIAVPFAPTFHQTQVAFTPPATEPALLQMPTLRTFIVEDNPVILNSLIATLEELSDVQVVGSVGSEREAVTELQQRDGEVDLVIVDIFLASGSGLGVLQSAQALKLPVRRVVLSNYATPDIRRRCLELGAHRVFDKSSELDELIAYCDEAAES